MTTTKTESYSLQVKHLCDAPRAKVFRAWLNPKALSAFHAPAEAFKIPAVTVDPRVGGQFRIEMVSPDGKSHVAVGTYKEIKAPEKLVYTWSWEQGGKMDEDEGDVGETLVTMEFLAQGNKTEVVLTHTGFPGEARKNSHTEGWTGILARLAKYIATA